jgi:hypothetical protein
MLQRFTEAMRAELEKPEAAPAPIAPSTDVPAAAPPIEVLSFGSQVAGHAIARGARRPAFWIVVGVLVLVGLYLLLT